MTTQQRTYLHADGDDGADPLTNLLNPGPNVSILPREPQMPQFNLTRFWLGIIVIIIAAVAVAGWLFVQ
jgi:hypothetical protein